jgi:ABC-2 type transport system permease protein
LKTELPSVLSVGIKRIGYELKSYVRTPDAVFFNFFFPLMMLVIFTVAFSNIDIDVPGAGRALTSADIYLPAMLAMGVLVSGTQHLGIEIAIEKHDGTLRRLSGSPISLVSYFIGKFGQVFVSATLQAIAIVLTARFVFGAYLPETIGPWLTFAWVFYLGLLASSILGIAISALPRSAKSATAVILPPILILQFISGIYLSFTTLPEWLQNFASLFPLKWIGQGFRAVFYPDQFKSVELGGDWFMDQVAIAIAIWVVLGVVFTLLTFRWVRKS